MSPTRKRPSRPAPSAVRPAAPDVPDGGFRIHSLEDEDEAPSYAKFCLYGWPGIGKTPFLATEPRTLIINCDGRGAIDSARATGSKAQFVNVTDYNEMEACYQHLRHGGYKDFEWVWWDSATLFQDRTLVDDILLEAHLRNPEKQDPDVPSQREYMQSQTRIARYMRQFIDLPVNFGATFHVATFETPEGNIMYCPLLQGGKNQEFSTKIQGYFNITGYLFSVEHEGETKRAIRFHQNDHFAAKDKFMKLPAVMGDPTIPKVMQYIKPAAKATAPTKKAARRPAQKEQ